MYVTRETIRHLETCYGTPRTERMTVSMTDGEFDRLRRSGRNGRAHDVTLYILEAGNVLVVRKPSYPLGLFRTPSGGIERGEDFESGAAREALEETGLKIVLHRYILRMDVVFACGDRRIPWTSHVFTAKPLGGEIGPLDTQEIAEAKMIGLDELKTTMRERLRDSPSSGLRYRAELDRLAVEEIERYRVNRKDK